MQCNRRVRSAHRPGRLGGGPSDDAEAESASHYSPNQEGVVIDTCEHDLNLEWRVYRLGVPLPSSSVAYTTRFVYST